MLPEVTTPPQHSKRIQAWVYVILNPLIESLRREAAFLGKGNLTWQSDTKKCEYIHPIREYIQYSQWPNYDDFTADPENLGFKEKFEEHDRAQSALELSASDFADGLMQSDLFQRQVKDSLEQLQSSDRANGQYVYLGSLPRAVAALLVNRIDVLPHHYGTHEFWEKYKGTFEPFREGTSFQSVKRAADALKDVSTNLLHDLENHRQTLCRTYDIPAAPISIDKSRSTDAFIV